MPVYWCKPGNHSAEPWRHGIQVYAYPFDMELHEDDSVDKEGEIIIATTTTKEEISSNVAHAVETSDTTAAATAQRRGMSATSTMADDDDVEEQNHDNDNSMDPPPPKYPPPHKGLPIRRIRHAEIVLVDDVCLAFQRYWLRLRWPGGKGGFAGYIALGKAEEKSVTDNKTMMETPSCPERDDVDDDEPQQQTTSTTASDEKSSRPKPITRLDSELSGISTTTGDRRPSPPTISIPQVSKEEQQHHDGFFAPSADYDDDDEDPKEASSSSSLMCLRTGLYFPSSSALELLARYDDGLTPPVVASPTADAQNNDATAAEPIMCRICREGLHDDEEQAPEEEGAPEEEVVEVEPLSSTNTAAAATTTMTMMTGPVQPHPAYHSNHYAAENPLLAPCECSGSMAFVHYLCIEQWRCRSRHPEAQNGLNCETCSAPYALPPPTSRPQPHVHHHPQQPAVFAEDDWLEAMPAHVMAALRQPHLVWQLGAAFTRRRWLRPLAPVLVSPVVALYCRARRLLKKRGVSRRRWACSLCRRRARWKCVRCLRSYYCSRQCQNVSWHIVHKHVCYKPSRFWWSVVVYSLLGLYLFPGVLRDPLVYDMGIALLPVSFYCIGVLGGGVATVMKKCAGVDLRGRMLELTVVLMTLLLFQVTWGVVWAFVGDNSMCMGLMMNTNETEEEEETKVPLIIRGMRQIVFRPLQAWFLFWDSLALRAPSLIRSAICPALDDDASKDTMCFSHTPNIDFFQDDPKCSSDMEVVGSLWVLAAGVLMASTLWKKHERRLRARARAARRRGAEEVHLHED